MLWLIMTVAFGLMSNNDNSYNAIAPPLFPWLVIKRGDTISVKGNGRTLNVHDTSIKPSIVIKLSVPLKGNIAVPCKHDPIQCLIIIPYEIVTSVCDVAVLMFNHSRTVGNVDILQCNIWNIIDSEGSEGILKSEINKCNMEWRIYPITADCDPRINPIVIEMTV